MLIEWTLLSLDIAFDFKFRDYTILMAIISQKQTLATVNSLKVVENKNLKQN